MRSHQRAGEAIAAGLFDDELVPVTLAGGTMHTVDETVRPATTAEGLAGLRPSFRTEEMVARFPELDWVITPGNSSPLTDGASAVLITSEERAAQLGLRARARFHTFAVVGDDPLFMLTGPIPATRRALEKSGLGLDDIDVYEVNEAFASVPLAWAHELGADLDKLNPRGGAISLGHALGSSGARVLATMINHLEASRMAGHRVRRTGADAQGGRRHRGDRHRHERGGCNILRIGNEHAIPTGVLEPTCRPPDGQRRCRLNKTPQFDCHRLISPRIGRRRGASRN